MTDWRERARARMKELGVTQERLAEYFGMTPAAIQKWLAGDRQPSLDQINLIADVLMVSRTWLTHGIELDCSTCGLAEKPRKIIGELILLEQEGGMKNEHWDAISAIVKAFGYVKY